MATDIIANTINMKTVSSLRRNVPVDIHAHVLYGVDDGPSSIQESVQMLKAAAQVGFGRIFATPHLYRFDKERDKLIFDTRQTLLPIADKLGIELRGGYEINIRAFKAGVNKEDVVSHLLEGVSAVLLELDPRVLAPNTFNTIGMILACKVGVIIAHPERYTYLREDFDKLLYLKEIGCKFQISMRGMEQKWQMRKPLAFVKQMTKAEIPVYTATDAHCAEDYLKYQRLCEKKM